VLDAAVPIIGIVKPSLATAEEEADGEATKGWPSSTTGVVRFQRDYFNCHNTQVYVDPSQSTYDLLGDRTLTVPWTKILTRPWAAWRDFDTINQRTKSKGVAPANGGEGAVLGGIIIVGKCDTTTPSFVYEEQIGQPIPLDTLTQALREAFAPA